jgi:hypothetical protein
MSHLFGKWKPHTSHLSMPESSSTCEVNHTVRPQEGPLLRFEVHLGNSATISMCLIVTRRAQCDQVLFFITTGVTPELHVMHL